MKDKVWGLNERQMKFCELLKTDCLGNQTEAYVRAFSTPTKEINRRSARVFACRLLAQDNIIAYIEHLEEQNRKSMRIDREDVIKRLMSIAASCERTKSIKKLNTTTGKMEDTGEVEMIDPKTSVMAWQQICKLLGMEEQKVKLSGAIEQTIIKDDI